MPPRSSARAIGSVGVGLTRSESTKRGIRAARERKARDDAASTWTVRTISRQRGQNPNAELLDSLFAEARARTEAHRIDLGGPSEVSSKEDATLLYEQGLWVISQLAAYVGIRNLSSDGAAEMFAKATSASRAGAGILKDLGLGRRAKPTHTLQTYLAEKAAQVDAERPNGEGPGSATLDRRRSR